LWRKDYSSEFEWDFPYFGTAASPLVWRDSCYVHFGGQDRDKPDVPGRGAMTALSVFDGREKWRWTGDAPAIGASPIISLIGDQVQLVFKSEEKIVGLDPRSGKEFWRIPFKVQMDNTIVTPLVIDDQLITSDYRMGVRSWRISSDGESWEAKELWKNDRVCMFMSSPVFAGGQLVGFSDFRKGELVGLDPRDGSIMWRGEPRSGEYATLISWGEDVMAFLEDGSMVVGKVSRDRFQILQRYRLGGSKMWTHPAISDNRIVIRDGSSLAVFQLGEQ
jgi:outer membrane protein assembly factor BamB